jgi:hypothetical protein
MLVLGVRDEVRVVLIVAVVEGDPLMVSVAAIDFVGEGEMVRVALEVGVLDGVMLGVPVALCVGVLDSVVDLDGDGVVDMVKLAERVVEGVEVIVREGVGEVVGLSDVEMLGLRELEVVRETEGEMD